MTAYTLFLYNGVPGNVFGRIDQWRAAIEPTGYGPTLKIYGIDSNDQ